MHIAIILERSIKLKIKQFNDENQTHSSFEQKCAGMSM